MIASLGLSPRLSGLNLPNRLPWKLTRWLKTWSCVCKASPMLALRVHQQARSTAEGSNPGSLTSPGVEFYTLRALLLGMSFCWSRPDNADNTAKPHSCLSLHPLPVQGSLIHRSWWCCLASKALWEFPRQNPTLATVN